MTFFEISTTKYEENIKLLQVLMIKMAAVCDVADGIKFGEPTQRYDWTFFQMLVDQELYVGIEDKFSDMIKKCKGSKPDEKFTNYLNQYLESKGCNVKIKMASG